MYDANIHKCPLIKLANLDQMGYTYVVRLAKSSSMVQRYHPRHWTKIRRLKPGQGRWTSKAIKICSVTSFGGESGKMTFQGNDGSDVTLFLQDFFRDCIK
jgi:hypothetical protein